MSDSATQSNEQVDKHPTDGVAFKNSKQATGETYSYLQEIVIGHIREESSEAFLNRVDISKTQILRVFVEDGVLSYEATHPHVTHEDEMEGEIDV